MAMTISNGHARVTCVSAIHSPRDDENSLVAAVIASTSATMLQAIKAHLEKNGGNHLTIYADDADNIMVNAAGRGYTHARAPFAPLHANGQAVVHVHPLAGDPRLWPAVPYCYVLVESGQDPFDKLYDRMQLALWHTLKRDWMKYILREGKEQELIEELPILGEHGYFTTAWRMEKNNDAWGEIISEGLRACQIKI